MITLQNKNAIELQSNDSCLHKKQMVQVCYTKNVKKKALKSFFPTLALQFVFVNATPEC